MITSPVYVVIKAADRFHTQTTRPNEMWQTDFTYFRMIGWGWMYLSTVLDVLALHHARKLCSTMRAEDVTDTFDLALAAQAVTMPMTTTNPACSAIMAQATSLAGWRTISKREP